MAKYKKVSRWRRANRRPTARARRRRSGGHPLSTLRKWNSKRSGRRARNAEVIKLKPREVSAKPDEIFEYHLFFTDFFANKAQGDKVNTEVTQWLRTCLASPFKVYRERLSKFTFITSVKLESESDLMMFMLCHREYVRKIFKLVKEPSQGLF